LSRTHNVVTGDTLYDIAGKYYGNPHKWSIILNANPQLSDSARIYPGQVLTIPDETENISNPTQSKESPESIQNVSDNAISILIDGNLFSFFTEYSMTFEIDTFDTFSFSAPFDNSIEIYREIFRPFSYKPVSIYYGKELIFTGVLLAPESAVLPDRREISISGYSKPGILNDCMMPITSFPLEFNNQKLEQITSVLCKPYGVQYRFLESSGNPFKKVSIGIDQNIFSFLSDLAKQRGLLITNDSKGKLVFWKSETGKSLASFVEGELPFISCAPSFDYQNFYSHITGVTSTTESKDSAKYTYQNKYLTKLGIMRNYNCTIDDAKDSDIKQAVLSKVGRMFGESASYELTIQGHIDRQRNIFKKNTTITLLSPGAMIYRETEFLIKSFTLNRGIDGDSTVFSLVLPGAYTGEISEIFPWEK